ncbi:flagellar biosynthetic protein FliO [Falsiroseomonas oryzae]|uniref:flagellar biosynthetic protein FliO n=1 Tax=Falsiroseomonas oryzae TaxID=2766473 RepID=UPI0022EA829C|nr:flagellar biosynthetic protein FliO [Roseomonas sp. MO-31]
MHEIGLTGLLTALAALAGVLGALVLVLRGLRATGLARQAGRRLAVTEAVALDARRRLVLVRCDGRDLLLLTGGAQDAVVGWLPVREPQA